MSTAASSRPIGMVVRVKINVAGSRADLAEQVSAVCHDRIDATDGVDSQDGRGG